MFASPYSANVILAKARAMYGNSLKPKDYINMLACHSVSEVAAYLKANTAYATVLADINENTIHRGHLETLLHRKLHNDYAALSRYDASTGLEFSKYLLMRSEIYEIMTCMRLMSAGRADEYVFGMPSYFASKTKINLVKLSRSTNFADLLDATSQTPYKAIIERFPPMGDGKLRLTEIETALFTYLTQVVNGIIAKTSPGTRRELTDLYGAQVDAQNVTRILRLKRYFNASPDTIRANLLPSGHCIAKSVMEAMIHAPDAAAVMDIFRVTSIARRIPEEQRMFEHDLHHRAPFFNARRHIHFSTHPSVVMLSYIMIMDVEMDDIINVIEGVRYGVPAEEILPMLVLAIT